MTSEEDESRAGFARQVSQLARLWRRAADQRLQPHGLTEATWLPLLHISQSKTPMRQKVLAAALSLDGSSIVRLIDNLELQGLVTRREEAGDRRAKEIVLTDKGRETVEALHSVITSLRNEAMADLNDADIATAYRVATHLADFFMREVGEES